MTETGKPNEDVWAIGDAAIIKSQLLPATAQGQFTCIVPQSPCLFATCFTFLVAEQKAKYVSKNLNRMAKDSNIAPSSLKPFEFHNMGSLAYLGNW